MDFCKSHDTCGKSFLKYYNRWKQSGKDSDLLPAWGGPKYRTKCPIRLIENEVTELGERGQLEVGDSRHLEDDLIRGQTSIRWRN
jgi:hypothetical protein